jgi:PhoH-like ATPase
MKYLIIDTNIPLSDANNIIALGSKDVTVVIPETVLAELDAKKSGYEEVNWQARGTARILSAAQVTSINKEDFGTITRLDLNGQELLIVGLNSYRNSPAEYGGNDQRIIEVAEKFTEFAKDDEVELMSTDFYMRLRALAIGVATTDLKLIDDTNFTFVKELEVEDLEVFRTLHNSDIMLVDKDYKLEHYSYKFSNTETGQIKLATISNGFIRVLGKEIEKALRLQDCPPINSEQLLASKAIQDP